MNNGIQIEIQESLSFTENEIAQKFAKKFISQYIYDDMKFKDTYGGWRSFYRRGTIGYRFDTNNDLYFRRASKSRRIYQIIKGSELKVVPIGDDFKTKNSVHLKRYKGEGQRMNHCICPKCSAQIRALNKYGDTKTYIYCTVGNIKG